MLTRNTDSGHSCLVSDFHQNTLNGEQLQMVRDVDVVGKIHHIEKVPFLLKD